MQLEQLSNDPRFHPRLFLSSYKVVLDGVEHWHSEILFDREAAQHAAEKGFAVVEYARGGFLGATQNNISNP